MRDLMPRRPVALTAAVVCLLCAATRSGAEPQARSFGAYMTHYQDLTFINEVIYPLGISGRVHRVGTVEQPIKLLDQYDILVLGAGGGWPMSVEEQQRVGEWLTDGGTLIVGMNEVRTLIRERKPEWLGRTDWAVRRIVVTDKARIANHPFTKGLRKAPSLDDLLDEPVPEPTRGPRGPVPPRLRMGLENGTHGGESLITDFGNVSLLWVRQVGKGQLIAVGGEVPAARSTPYVQNHISYELDAQAITVWKNLVEQLRPTRRGDVITRWAADQRRDMALWWRYERERPTGGAMMTPPVPQPGDELDALRLDMGRGERMWWYFMLTTLKPQKAVRFEIADLRSEAGHTINGQAIQPFLLAAPQRLHAAMTDLRPLPDHHKAPYYLVPFEHAPPFDRPTVDLHGPETHTFWLEVFCDAATPAGEYHGELRIVGEGDETLATLPLQITVWPLRQPAAHTLHFEFEHSCDVLPGGSILAAMAGDATRYDPSLAARCMKQIGELGIDVGQVYGYIHQIYGARFVKLLESGQPVDDAVTADPALLRRDPLPALDFSFYDDFYFNSAIDAGLTTFATNYVISPDMTLTYAKRIDPEAQPMSPEHQRIVRWYLSEFARYVRQRGYVDVYCKTMDEFGPEHVESFLPAAKLLGEAGFGVYTTTPNVMFDAASAQAMAPFMKLWQGQMLASSWRQTANDRLGVTLRPDSAFWPYNASSVPGLTMDSGRFQGWLAAYARHPGFHMHHYFRHYWTDTQPALAGPDRLYNSGAAISYAHSVFRGRYLASLLNMIDRAKQLKADPAVIADVERELSLVIGEGEGAILRLKETESTLAQKQGQTGVMILSPHGVMSADPRDHERAKVRVIELTLKLRPLLAELKPTIRYGQHVLVDNGTVTYELLGDGEGWAPLRDQVSRVIGDGAIAAAPTTRLACGMPTDPAIKAQLPRIGNRVNERFPAPGHYAIFTPPREAGQPDVIVVGGDEDGTHKGVAALTRFLIVEDQW